MRAAAWKRGSSQVRGGGGEGLLSALGALVEARSSSPGTTVQALSYREGALDMKMAAPNADAWIR